MNLLKKKNIIISILVLIELIFLLLAINSFNNKGVYLDINTKENESLFAMYLKNEITNEYEEYTKDDFFPSSGYRLDDSLTNCIDNSGNSVIVSLYYINGIVRVKSNKTVFCYLYFDLEEPPEELEFKLLVDVFKNNPYVKEYRGEGYYHDSIDYDSVNPFFTRSIYYWYGISDTEQNTILNKWNVVFADSCWQMIRTTEEDGVKLLYNGKPVIGSNNFGNPTYNCSNTISGYSRSNNIGASSFNEDSNSLAYVGYMYNDNTTTKGIGTITQLILGGTSNINFESQTIKIGTSIVDNKNGTYTIGNVSSYNLSSLTSTVDIVSNKSKKYYICNDYVSTTCKYGDARLIINANLKKDSGIGTEYHLTNKNYGTYIWSNKISKGTTTLLNPQNIIALDWYIDYDNYNNKYLCISGNTNCELRNINYVITANGTNIHKFVGKFNFTNKISYDSENNKYILDMTDSNAKNTLDDAGTILKDIKKAHYFCVNVRGSLITNTTECEYVGYAYYVSDNNVGTINYILLNEGKYVSTDVNSTNNDNYLTKFADDNNIIYSMLYSENVNKTNSTIKNKVDDWYEETIDGTIYESLIDKEEIYCNDRRTSNNFGGWNLNSDNFDEHFLFTQNNPNGNINCPVKTDAFSASENTYGNGDLIYPTGLLSASELYILTGSSSSAILRASVNSWLGSPSYLIGKNNELYCSYFDSNGYLKKAVVPTKNSVRPAIALKHDVGYRIGDGSLTNPYIIEYNN